MSATSGYEAPGVAGTGTIATGVAAIACSLAPVTVLARSTESANRARLALDKQCDRLEEADPSRITVTTDPAALAGCDLIVEAIAEDATAKVTLLRTLAAAAADADLASTTSSLAISELASGAGVPERFFGLHVFNPVAKMDLIELCLPEILDPGVGERARRWCEALGKEAVEVPDVTAFVVNRLLFAYLFDAVRLCESSGMEPEAVDRCMKLGAGHPMGPLALIDFVGVDVAIAIGEELHSDTGEERHRPPAMLAELQEAGRLGRKSGGGFFDY